MVEFNQDNQEKFKEYLGRYPNKKAAILPTLWLAQDQFGVLTHQVMEYVAGLLELSPVHVYSVATFYTMYHKEPVGKYHIQLCRTLSCALCGSEEILDYIKEKLGIDEKQITADGRFSLETVECLASCGTAPAMMINETYYENLTKKKVDEILEACQ